VTVDSGIADNSIILISRIANHIYLSMRGAEWIGFFSLLVTIRRTATGVTVPTAATGLAVRLSEVTVPSL
jgi:hypothetical protein